MLRLLTTLLLNRSGYVVGRYISIETKIGKTKANYYAALEQSRVGWHEGSNDSTLFIKYLLAIIFAAYRGFESRFAKMAEKMPVVG